MLVTGALGGSLAARHLAIVPRVDAGRWLFAHGARAMMDVSDGLAWDLFRMARASGVAIEIDLDSVPVHVDAHARAHTTRRTALWHALHDGEDHELIATVPQRRLAQVARRATAHCPELAVIGRVQCGRGLFLCDAHGRRRRWNPKSGGFRHGG